MKKREYLTLGGLFIALHLVFVLMSKFLPGSSLLLVIFLPLLSAIYTLKFNRKEVAMFCLATFFLCLIFEPVSTLIYIIPSLICGVGYGICRKKDLKELMLIYVSSLAHSLSLLISFLFLSLLFKEVDFFNIFKSFIDKDGQAFYVCIYLVLIVLGLIEAFIVHMICDDELEKLGYDRVKEEKEASNWIVLGFAISFIVYSVIAIINPVLSIYALPFVVAFITPIVIEFIKSNKRKWLYIPCGIILFFSIFLLSYLPASCYLMIPIWALIPITLEKIVRVLYTFCLKYSNKRENIIE